MSLMKDIETLCRGLSHQRAKLRKKYEAKQKAINAVNAEHDPGIRELQMNCSMARSSLLLHLESGRELFKKPKSQTFSGITVGFEKQRSSLTMPDEIILVDRIEKLLPANIAETVLDRKATIIKAAFKKLGREILQKLGCSIITGADKPVVHTNDDDIETLVHKSLGDGSSIFGHASSTAKGGSDAI